MDARPDHEKTRHVRKLVLCFDGTGNKFRGDDSDSNILKIFRCLDRTAGDQYHYYQPGIGTYVVSGSLSHTSVADRIKSWYLKAKDSAVGTSFDHHVVGGYRFLMRFYQPGDEIYFFGFSRGAYVARFLAEMLDYVGLLSHGNEEMVTFAWKAFSQWQSRQSDATEHDRAKRHEMYRFMKGFRETFSRPVKSIRFLGLFDTVNSVPRFEAAWMQRSKFPYTARTSAKVIRHCVSIDERRAKFRQDLIYQGSAKAREHKHEHVRDKLGDKLGEVTGVFHERYRAKHKDQAPHAPAAERSRGRPDSLAPPQDDSEERAFRPNSRSTRSRSRIGPRTSHDGISLASPVPDDDDDSDSDDEEQDIDEIWFAGGHGDIGGGWDFVSGTKSASHVPLVYMIREAEKAGLSFDYDTLVEMGIAEEIMQSEETQQQGKQQKQQKQQQKQQQQQEEQEQEVEEVEEGDIPQPDIRIDISGPTPPAHQTLVGPILSQTAQEAHQKETMRTVGSGNGNGDGDGDGNGDGNGNGDGDGNGNGDGDGNGNGDGNGKNSNNSCEENESAFHAMLHKAHLARIHDSLEFGGGLTVGQVAAWKIMEYMPFRRMDLRSDGSWKPIRWPLPCGETRDIPRTARVHGSVIRRIREDPTYRPGNLIIGGGGRGVRKAGTEWGTGDWECVQSPGDPVCEIWVRKPACDKECGKDGGKKGGKAKAD